MTLVSTYQQEYLRRQQWAHAPPKRTDAHAHCTDDRRKHLWRENKDDAETADNGGLSNEGEGGGQGGHIYNIICNFKKKNYVFVCIQMYFKLFNLSRYLQSMLIDALVTLYIN